MKRKPKSPSILLQLNRWSNNFWSLRRGPSSGQLTLLCDYEFRRHLDFPEGTTSFEVVVSAHKPVDMSNCFRVSCGWNRLTSPDIDVDFDLLGGFLNDLFRELHGCDWLGRSWEEVLWLYFSVYY